MNLKSGKMRVYTGIKLGGRWLIKRAHPYKYMIVQTKTFKIDFSLILPSSINLDRAPSSTRCSCIIDEELVSFSTLASKNIRPRSTNRWLATASRSRTWLWRLILTKIVFYSTFSESRIKTWWWQRPVKLVSYKTILKLSRRSKIARNLWSWSISCSDRSVTKLLIELGVSIGGKSLKKNKTWSRWRKSIKII